MPSDAEITIAFVWKRQGSARMAQSEWVHVLSLELGWMAPGEARTFVAGSVESGLLVEEDGVLFVGFDASNVTVPRGFRPPLGVAAAAPKTEPKPKIPTEPTQDLFGRLLDRLEKETEFPRDKILEDVSAIQIAFGGQLSGEAAILRVSIANGLDVAEDARGALQQLTSESTPAR